MKEKMFEYDKQVKENFKINYITNITDGVFFSFGLGFISITTILPYFVSQLTDSKLLISLIVSILMFGSNLPQLFSAGFAETFKKKKKAILVLGFMQRLPFILLFIFTYAISGKYDNLLLIIFFICWTLFSISSGIVVPFWFDMVSKVIPVKNRGKFFGYRSFLGSILEVLAAFIAGIIIKTFAFPLSFHILFGLTSFTLMISFSVLFFVKEPEYPISKKRIGVGNYLKKLPTILKEKGNFRYYLISIFFTEFIGMINGLFTIAGIDIMNLSGASAAALVSISSVILISSQSVSSVIWGYISDKLGHKKILLSTSIFNLLGVITAIIANNLALYYLVFVFIGLALGGTKVSFLAIIPEFCSQEDVPTFVAITNTAKGITVTIISLIGGLLADLYNFEVVFIISALMIFIGVVLLKYKVVEPRFDKSTDIYKQSM